MNRVGTRGGGDYFDQINGIRISYATQGWSSKEMRHGGNPGSRQEEARIQQLLHRLISR